MKLRVIDRLISAAVGILLLAMSVIVLTEMVFSDRLLTTLGSWAAGKGSYEIAALVVAALIMALAGVMSFQLAVRRTKSKNFVVQTTDVGELSISIRAIENLVQRCVEKHEELHVTSTTLDNTRDGLVISMRISLASGVNIPLAVNALQKQIKQYVTACSGVDVYEVKVQVDTTAAKGNPSVYAVPEMLENVALPREEEVTPEVEAESEPVEAKEEKCLHQRLFGEEEQPAIVPVPPEMEATEEPAEEAVEDQPAEEETAAEEITEEAESVEETEAVEEASAEETAADVTDEADEAEDELPDAEELPEGADAVEYGLDEESVADLEALDGAEDLSEEDLIEPVKAEDEEEITPEPEA